MKKVDARGDACPIPVVKAKHAGDRRDHHGTRLFHRPRLRKCVQLLALYRQNRF